VFMSSQNYLTLVGGKQVQVGFYLDEFYFTAQALVDAGYYLQIVTPEGNTPPMDPSSNSSAYFESQQQWEEALQFVSTLESILQPMPLIQFYDNYDVNDYAAVFVPGGHAPIIDLMGNVWVGEILTAFWAQGNKPMGFICHGPLVMLSTAVYAAEAGNSSWPFAGLQMTVFSQKEEMVKELTWGAQLGFYPNTLLAGHGAVMDIAAPFTSNFVVDGMLITGQNPQSAQAFAEGYMQLLSKTAA